MSVVSYDYPDEDECHYFDDDYENYDKAHELIEQFQLEDVI